MRISILLFFLVFQSKAFAEEYTWISSANSLVRSKDPEELCRIFYFYYKNRSDAFSYNKYIYAGYDVYAPSSGKCFIGILDKRYNSESLYTSYMYREGGSCKEGETNNEIDGVCESDSDIIKRKQLGLLSDGLSCSPTYDVGNPINVSNGNKKQKEIDLSNSPQDNVLGLYRYYNGFHPYWRHNYSYQIIDKGKIVYIVTKEGKKLSFKRYGNSFVSDAEELGVLVSVNEGWRYVDSKNSSFYFDKSGRLISIKSNDYYINVSYSGKDLIIENNYGGHIVITEDEKKQPLRLIAKDFYVDYIYDTFGRLVKVKKTFNGVSKEIIYHYDDSYNMRLLTGITDERGIRYATWTYDDQGRAISSEHAGGAEKVTLAYNADGSTTVTNELGKQTTYRFQVIQGVKRIVSIEGEPTANCPAANSTYTYNDRGQVLTKTDANGNVTQYSYNDRGLEVSRTEGYGTAEAQTVTTEWDATRFLPVKVVKAGRTTTYSYDSQGRLLSQQVTTVN